MGTPRRIKNIIFLFTTIGNSWVILFMFKRAGFKQLHWKRGIFQLYFPIFSLEDLDDDWLIRWWFGIPESAGFSIFACVRGKLMFYGKFWEIPICVFGLVVSAGIKSECSIVLMVVHTPSVMSLLCCLLPVILPTLFTNLPTLKDFTSDLNWWLVQPPPPLNKKNCIKKKMKNF